VGSPQKSIETKTLKLLGFVTLRLRLRFTTPNSLNKNDDKLFYF